MRRHFPGMRASSFIVFSDAGQLLGRVLVALAELLPAHHDLSKLLCGRRSEHPAVLGSHVLDENPEEGTAAWITGTDTVSRSCVHH